MIGSFKICLAALMSATWLLVPLAHAQDAKVATKQTPVTQTAATPPRVSPYAKYAREHAEANKGTVYPRVSGLSMHRTHRVAGQPSR